MDEHMNFINQEQIFDLLANHELTSEQRQLDALAKAAKGVRLTLEDVAALLRAESPEVLESIHQAARGTKQEIYGNRIVFFAPLYLSNRCINNCLYCSFRRDNTELLRSTLTQDEIRHEVEFLIAQGHKRLLLVAGEHPKESSLDYIGESVRTVYDVDVDGNNIRRVNINAAPLSVEDFRRLKTFGIGTYQCFQETYHRETYAYVHPSGMKADYDWRVEVMDRALEAGIDDVGVGILFGLYDYRFEALALMQHIFHLEENFNGVGPHTISIPRLEPALNAPLDSTNSPWTVSDEHFQTLVAILRIAVPYTGIILSTREQPEARRKLFDYGVSQISAGSKTDPGGYLHANHATSEQFQLGDHRPMDEVVKDILALGYLPSFCTACYRSGRTGDRFMDLAKSGNIGKICTPNGLATFVEYLNDFGDDEMRSLATPVIDRELGKLPEAVKEKAGKMIRDINNGEKDVFL
jgi:2-iminoacetate synthase